jgi:cytochrome b6-f complex iron-sulfur subunit
MTEGSMTRRSFLTLLRRGLVVGGAMGLLGSIVAYFYPARLEEVPGEPVPAGTLDELPPGTAKVIPYGRYPAMVIHTPEGLRAYSAVCTHFGCVVKWNAPLERIDCPCHDGFFDPLDGSVISGPPPRPLEALAVSVSDGRIFVGGTA